MICRQTPGSKLPDHCGWPCCLREGVTPTTVDQIKFDVFLTDLNYAPARPEQKKLENAECASQKEETANGRAVGLGTSSLERRKHTLASYLMGPNAVGRHPCTRTWRPTGGPSPQRRCKAPGGTWYAPVQKNCSKGMCTPHCLSFKIAYAKRFGTCKPCKYKKFGFQHRLTPRATDAIELAPCVGDWQGHLDEPRWGHVAQNEENENEDSDSIAVIDEHPLAQPQSFSACQCTMPVNHAEEEPVEVYLETLLGSAPGRISLFRRPGDTKFEDVDFAEAQTAILLHDLDQPPPGLRREGPPRIAAGACASLKRNYHCTVCYSLLVNTAVLPCGHTICTDCAGRISRCPLDGTVEFADGTRFPLSRIRTWHAVSDN